ncbi:mannosyltransferase [Microbotryomycetes sp. JL221]|nr:mannosyltransferase [Microbotryomycetes sp. JL221]
MLTNHKHCHFVYLTQPLAFASRLPRLGFIALVPLRVILVAWSLLYALLFRLESTPQFIIVQNPPSIPTLPVLKLVNAVTHSKLVIDWHNTGYSVLALRLGTNHPVVKLARAFEFGFGRSAHAHLCVTEGMKQSLQKDAQLKGNVRVFYDRPPSTFHRLSAEEAHEFFSREPTFVADSSLSSFRSNDLPNSTLFTQKPDSGPAMFDRDRPALLVSATSWTPDEDFNILLEALSLYDKAFTSYEQAKGGLRSGSRERERTIKLPKIVVVVTGKGAGRTNFEQRVTELENTEWKNVKVRTSWLAIEDYPKLLGSADLGICLHTSTSGVDLPMKVVDMFGCELPVCAVDFPCLIELVRNGRNGVVFQTAQDLANSLIDLLRYKQREEPEITEVGEGLYPLTSKLAELKQGIRTVSYGHSRQSQQEKGDAASLTDSGLHAWRDWNTNWNQVVKPLLL